MFLEGIEFETDLAAVRAGNGLILEIDRDHRIGAALGIVHQLVDVLLR